MLQHKMFCIQLCVFMISNKIMWNFVTYCQTVLSDILCYIYSEQEVGMLTDRHT